MKALDLNPGASSEHVSATLGHALPGDYCEFLGASDGGEGFIGDSYVILWKSEDLKRLNDAYQVAEYAPGLLVFGSNGGGDAYAFDTRTTPWRVVQVPFVGMDFEYADVVGESFSDFLRRLGEKE